MIALSKKSNILNKDKIQIQIFYIINNQLNNFYNKWI